MLKSSWLSQNVCTSSSTLWTYFKMCINFMNRTENDEFLIASIPFFSFHLLLFFICKCLYMHSSRQFFYLIFSLFASLLFLSRAVVNKNWLFLSSFLFFWSFFAQTTEKKIHLGFNFFFYLISVPLRLAFKSCNTKHSGIENFFFWFFTCNQHLMWDEKFYFFY